MTRRRRVCGGRRSAPKLRGHVVCYSIFWKKLPKHFIMVNSVQNTYRCSGCLPMLAGSLCSCSGRRSGEAWLDDAGDCEDLDTIPSAVPALHQTDTAQETLGCEISTVVHMKPQERQELKSKSFLNRDRKHRWKSKDELPTLCTILSSLICTGSAWALEYRPAPQNSWDISVPPSRPGRHCAWLTSPGTFACSRTC